MSPSDAQGILLASCLLATVAVAVFELWKSEARNNRQRCICGHPLVARGDGGHVQRMNADSKAFWPGAEFNPLQCRACRCRQFIWDGVKR